MNNENGIQLPANFDDLSKHAPLLHNLRKKGDGFAVPENYFEASRKLAEAKTHLPEKDGFSVPENYFEELAERIISIAQLHGLKGNEAFDVPEGYFEKFAGYIVASANLSLLKEKEAFDVPEGYFEKLTDEMISAAEIASLKKEEPFIVPENYFEDLSATLETKLALDNIRQDEGFETPDNYFEKLTETVVSRAAMDELSKGSDADVPEGYFDTLADRVAARIAEEENRGKEETIEKGRVIVFAEVIRRYARPAAIAASAALLIGASIWFFSRTNGENKIAPIAKQEQPKQITSPVIPPVTPQDTIRAKQSSPAMVAASSKKVNRRPKKNIVPPEINHDNVALVKVEKKDVLEQLDLLDENIMVDAVNHEEKKNVEQETSIINGLDISDLAPGLNE